MGWRILLGLLPFCLLFAAGDTPLDRSTLRGLKAVNVVVDPIEPELPGTSGLREALQGRFARRLETAGIPMDPDATEFLALRLIHVRAGRGPHAVSLTLSVYQPVTLVRQRDLRTATGTWGVQTILLSDPKRLEDSITRAADELLDAFIAAYYAVNPNGAPTPPQ